MEWKLFKDEKPTITNMSNGWTESLIVFNGEDVIDDCIMHWEHPNPYLSEKEIKYKFWVHRFGYDNDCYEVKNVTHWMYLPEPPTTQ